MKYLLSGSFFFLLGCTSAYKDLYQVEKDPSCLEKFIPAFEASWYRTSVNVTGKHISGLLLIKTMPDDSKRIVFTNEAGITFFDFEFTQDGFVVHQVIRQLDKKPVINTLRKDFEMLLMTQIRKGEAEQFQRGDTIFHGYAGKKEINYFVTDKNCSSLLRIEKASRRKKKVEVKLFNVRNNVPDSVAIQHFLFNMQIQLKKLKR
jgi:hypothetical protein